MKNLTIAILGIALMWGLSGCADHRNYYSGYYASGYPSSSLYTGATYSSYPGYPGYRPYYRPYVARSWPGPTGYYSPSGYGAWPVYPAYYAPYPAFSVSLGYLYVDNDWDDGWSYYRPYGYYPYRYYPYRYDHKAGHDHDKAPFWKKQHTTRYDQSKGHDGGSRDRKSGQWHRVDTGHGVSGKRDETGTRQPVVRHNPAGRDPGDPGVTIEYRHPPHRDSSPRVGRSANRLPNMNNPVSLPPAIEGNVTTRRVQGVSIEQHRWSDKDESQHFQRSTDRLPNMHNPVTLPSSTPRTVTDHRRTTVRDTPRNTERFHNLKRTDQHGERSYKRSRSLDRGHRSIGDRSFCMNGRC